MISVDECLFCGRKRVDEGGCLAWTKTVCLRPDPVTVTVCPDCRGKYSVEAFFRRARRLQARRYTAGGIGGSV